MLVRHLAGYGINVMAVLRWISKKIDLKTVNWI
jgi:hypothetical protein